MRIIELCCNTKRSLRYLASFILICTAVTLAPLTAQEYTYDALLTAVYEQNAELKAATESYVQSTFDVKDAKAAFQPTIGFGLSASLLYNYPMANLEVDLQELFAGSPIAPTMPAGKSPITDFPNNNFGLSLTLQQPIFLWGKVAKSVDLYTTVSDINNIQLYDLQNKLTAELKTRLAALHFLQSILNELSQQKEHAQNLIYLSEQGQKEGSLLAQDVLEARMEAREIDVTIAQIQNEISSILFRLQTMTGIFSLDIKSIIYTVEMMHQSHENALTLLLEDRNALITKALSPERSAMQSVNLAYTAAHIADGISSASMYWKPDIALQASLDYGGSIESFQDTGFSDTDKLSASVSIGIQTDLWDGGKKLNSSDRTQSKIRAAEANIEQVELSIRQSLNEQLNAIALTKTQIDFLRAKTDTVELRIQHEEQLFQLGGGPESDILQSKIELGTTRIQEFQQRMNLLAAFYTVQYLLGE